MHFCDRCGYSTDRLNNFTRHQQSHINKEARASSQVLTCTYCDQKFTNHYNCKRHMELYCKHRPVVEDLPHIQVEPVSTSQLHTCEGCKKNFTRKHDLERHALRCKGVSNPLECHKCHKVLSCAASKSRHLKTCNSTLTNTGTIINATNVQYIENCSIHYHMHPQVKPNDLGKEDKSYITTDQINESVKTVSTTGMAQYIKLVHFQPSHPENQTFWLPKDRNASLKEAYYVKDGRCHRDSLDEVLEKVIYYSYMDLCKHFDSLLTQAIKDNHMDDCKELLNIQTVLYQDFGRTSKSKLKKQVKMRIASFMKDVRERELTSNGIPLLES